VLEAEMGKESQTMQFSLNPQQMAEYRRLKSEAEKRSAAISEQLNTKLREQDCCASSIEVKLIEK
jgi:hypothetical protein